MIRFVNLDRRTRCGGNKVSIPACIHTYFTSNTVIAGVSRALGMQCGFLTPRELYISAYKLLNINKK